MTILTSAVLIKDHQHDADGRQLDTRTAEGWGGRGIDRLTLNNAKFKAVNGLIEWRHLKKKVHIN